MSFFSVILVRSSVKTYVFFSWGLLWSILGLEDDPPTLENLGFVYAGARLLKKKCVFDPKMVLRASWGSLGPLLGALGGLLGSSGVLLGVSWGLLGSQGTILGSPWVLLLSFFSALLVRSSSKSLCFMSCGLFGSILGLQDDPPNLKNLDFAADIH